MLPMLASRGRTVPSGDDWLHEIKWDGYRALASIRGGSVRLTSRTERDMSASFPEFEALRSLPDGVVLDGEIVVFQDGVPLIHGVAERFQVQNRQRAARLAETYPATFMVFDVLECLGQSVLNQPLVERRRLLEALPIAETGVARVSPTYPDGEALLEAARAQSLEGIVSKRRQSLYRPGVRSPDWLKFPLREQASFVVGGFRWERAGARVGSLLIGEPVADGLEYRGRVALAVPARTERAMARQLHDLAAPASPFITVPAEERGAEWVEPTIVIDVEFLDRTSDGRLRHPVYVSQRMDLDAADLR